MSAKCLLYIAIALSLAPVGRCTAECIQKASGVGHKGAVLSEYVCRAVSPWRRVPGLLAPFKIVLNCPTPKFTVHVDTSGKPPGTEIRWCGFKHLNDPKTCSFEIAPFHDTLIRIKSEPASSFSSANPEGCSVEFSRDVDLLKMGMLVGGVVLFFNAEGLAMSSGFRLSAGSAMFMSGAVLVLLFLFMRSVPQKRAIFAAMTVSASSVLGLARFIYGTWAPNALEVITSKPFVFYMIITGLLGLGVTYWMDDLGNVKLNTTIRVTLQLLGLLGVYNGTCSDMGSLTIIGCLVFGRVMSPFFRILWRVLSWLALKLGSFMPRAKGRAAASATILEAAGQQQLGAQPKMRTFNSLSFDQWQEEQPVFGTGHAAAAGGNNRRSTDACGPGEFPGFASGAQGGLRLRQAQEGLPPPAAGGAAGPSLAGRTAAAAAATGRFAAPESPPAATPAGQSASRGGWFRSPAPPPPPDEWLYRHDRAPPSPPEAAAPARPSSPWAQEKVVLSVGRSKAKPAAAAVAAPAASPRSAASGPAAAIRGRGGSSKVSPLVVQGKILNLQTNKPIQIDKPKYKELVAAGWVPDFKHGTLLPPGSILADDSDDE